MGRGGSVATEAPLSAHTTTAHLRHIATHVSSIFTSGTARSASARVTAVCAASAHTLATAAREMTFGASHDSSAGVEVKEEREEEETLGQLRDRQVLAAARVPVPGPRATNVHIKVEDTTSGEDTDGEGGEQGDGEEATG